jgi:homoserine dehydrogenase
VAGAVPIAILGHGTVGRTVLTEIVEHHHDIEPRYVLVQDLTKEGRDNLESTTFLTDYQQILDDPDVQVVVELMGGLDPAHTYIRSALDAGRNVVTANKAIIANHGRELLALASNKGKQLNFEAAVGGGLPLIRVVKQLRFDQSINLLAGILNGTTNFILSMMGTDRDYATALGIAQDKGLAELKPRLDVNGTDSAQKLAILTSLAFGTWVEPQKVAASGIVDEDDRCILYPQDIHFFHPSNDRLPHAYAPFQIKLLSVAEKRDGVIQLISGLALVAATNALSNVEQEFNALWVSGPGVQRQYYFYDPREYYFYGPGAGALPTATAVISGIADIIDHRDASEHLTPRNDFSGPQLPVVDQRSIMVHGYIRSISPDIPGVFQKKLNVLADFDLDVQEVHNVKVAIPGIPGEPDYIRIQPAAFGKVQSALAKLATLEGTVVSTPVFFRVEANLPTSGPIRF